ncbi:MAG: S41 family peptidase [Chloroflexota bacterium]
MKLFGKIWIFILILIVAPGSFAAGMVFYAYWFSPVQAESVAAALSLPVGNGREQVATPETVPEEFATFWEAWSFLNDKFYGEIPPDNERVYGAIRGMVASFGDQNTAFIDPVRAAVMSENISGSFEGIGATIRLDEAGRLVVVDPIPDGPAFKAGLHPDDIILEVDGQTIENLSLYEAVLLIRGPAGSQVVLTIFREGELKPFDVAIVRDKIEIEVVESDLLPDDIGYIRLTQFNNGAAGKIFSAGTDLLDRGATRLILDLRSNPGGLLSEAVAVSSLFLDEGVVVIERLKGGEEKRFEVDDRHLDVDIPLVVLVNGGSASASEIVAGAIQDYKRGVIIGEQTFGKGSVQLPHNLTDGSELRVTIAEWLTPTERHIHGQGITPDIVIEMTRQDFEQELDPQLDEAIEVLRGS